MARYGGLIEFPELNCLTVVLTREGCYCSLRTVGGTPSRDPSSLLGLIWGLPRDMGVI